MEIRPKELNNPRYYMHLAIITAIVLAEAVYIDLFDFSWLNAFWLFSALLMGDILAHTLMGLD